MANTFNNKAKRDSRERMIKALYELVQTRRVQDISISEICELAQVNRTTFYNHYDNISGLTEDARNNIVSEYTSQFGHSHQGYNPNTFLILFKHIYDNQIIYKTYFRLNPSYIGFLGSHDPKEAKRFLPGQDNAAVLYHAEFFAAGLTAIIRRWLAGGCKETPQEMVKIISSEYNGRV